jgi:RHS repeat-associated protein
MGSKLCRLMVMARQLRLEYPGQISLTTPAGTATGRGDFTVAGALASPSGGVNSHRDSEVGPGMELTRVAGSQERRPVERIASLGFAVGDGRYPATGFSLYSVRLFDGESAASADFGAFGWTVTGVGLGSEVVPRTAGSAASVAIKPKAVSAVGRRYSFYSPEMNLLAETEITTSGTPAIQYEYVWFNGHPVAQVDPGPTTHWTFTDHLGTPLIQTDDAGAVPYWRAEYEPFGRVFSLRTADQHQPLRLPGQEAEELNTSTDGNGATERSYNIFRWYRPAWGRYTQSDPIASAPAWNVGQASASSLTDVFPGGPTFGVASQMQAGSGGGGTSSATRFDSNVDVNLYRYAADDPIENIDPEGLAPYKFCFVLKDTAVSTRRTLYRVGGLLGINFYVTAAIRRRCEFRCYCSKDRCPDFPCNSPICQLDHGVTELRYFTNGGNAVPACMWKITEVMMQGKCG